MRNVCNVCYAYEGYLWGTLPSRCLLMTPQFTWRRLVRMWVTNPSSDLDNSFGNEPVIWSLVKQIQNLILLSIEK